MTHIIYACKGGHTREPEGEDERSANPHHNSDFCSSRTIVDGYDWCCTRLKGHGGNHIACTTHGYVCCVWNNEPEAPSVPIGMTITTNSHRIVLTGIEAPDVTKAAPPKLTIEPALARAVKALALEFRDDLHHARGYSHLLITQCQKDACDLDFDTAESIVLALQAAFSVEPPKSAPTTKTIQVTEQVPYGAANGDTSALWLVLNYDGRSIFVGYEKEQAEQFASGTPEPTHIVQYVSAEQCEGLVGRTVFEALDVNGKTTSVHATKEGALEASYDHLPDYVYDMTIEE